MCACSGVFQERGSANVHDRRHLRNKYHIHVNFKLYAAAVLQMGLKSQGGTLIFSSYVGSGPASTVHLYKIPGISSTQFRFEILATPTNIAILYLDLKKRPQNA